MRAAAAAPFVPPPLQVRTPPPPLHRAALLVLLPLVLLQTPAERVGRPPAGPIPARGPSAVVVGSLKS